MLDVHPQPQLDSIFESEDKLEDKKSKAEKLTFFGDEKRSEGMKNAFHITFKIGLIVVGLVSIAIFALRLIHLVMPACWQWMSADQVQGIDKLFFSGAIGGLLANNLKKITG